MLSMRVAAPILLAVAIAMAPAWAQPAKPPAHLDTPAPLQPGDAFGENVTLPERTIIAIKGHSKWDDAFATLVDAFKSLDEYIDKHGIKPTGPAMTIYTETDDTGFKFRAALPVGQQQPFSGRAVISPGIGLRPDQVGLPDADVEARVVAVRLHQVLRHRGGQDPQVGDVDPGQPEHLALRRLEVVPDRAAVGAEELVAGDLHLHLPRVPHRQRRAVGPDRPDSIQLVPRPFVARLCQKTHHVATHVTGTRKSLCAMVFRAGHDLQPPQDEAL